MTWFYNNEPINEIDSSFIGFVYLITNLVDGRKYIGKKKCFFQKTNIKTITVKSTGLKKKKKIRSLIDSDWRDYYGSSEELKADVEKLGKDKFRREITRFCISLSELSYYEIREQLVTDCLLYPDQYYNSWVSARVRRAHMLPKSS